MKFKKFFIKNKNISASKRFSLFIFVIILTLGLSISFQSILAAWTAPSVIPPICDSGDPGCDAPINIGPTTQSKVGGLGVIGPFAVNDNSYFAGNVGVGTMFPESTLQVDGTFIAGQGGINATLNPNDKGDGITLSNGNLTATYSDSIKSIRGNEGKTSGKWYWEVTIDNISSGAFVGVGNADANLNWCAGCDSNSWTYYGFYVGGGKKFHGSGTGVNYGLPYTTGDVIGVALDMDSGTLTFYKNGVSQGQAFSGITGTIYPEISGYSTSVQTVNFGQTAFLPGMPPSGYGRLYEPPEGIILNENNKVGIGNGDPTYNLDVSGDINFTGNLYRDGTMVSLGGSQWTTSDSNIYYNTGNVGIGATNPTNKLDVSGAIRTTGQIKGPTGVPTSPAFTDSSQTNRGMYFPADSDRLGLVTVGQERVRIDQNGNVGIGTTNPSEKLDVNGNINVAAESYYKYAGSNLAMAQPSLYNYFFGGAGNLTMTGSYNTATGFQALNSNSTGYQNTATGFQALNSNSTGYQNTATGFQALNSNSTGVYNTAIGYQTLYSNNTGYFNTAAGHRALYSNTSGTHNTATGLGALNSNTTGSYNTATGFGTLDINTAGSYNTAVGLRALNLNTTGGTNTAVGYYALSNNTTGSYNTAIGYGANVSSGALTNATAIGNGATVNASNKIVLGNASATTVGGYGAWQNYSDRRLKENIIYKNDLGLNFISKLKPVSFNYIADENKTRRDGLIAQDVARTLKELGLEFSGLTIDNDKTKTMNLGYSEFVIPLITAVQEQQAEIKQLKADNKSLEERIFNLEKKLK